MKIPKIIAIDVGHCENVASYPSDNGTGTTISYYCLNGKEQLMSSLIFLSNEQMSKLHGKPRPTFNELQQLGNISIGDDIPANLPEGELFCYFKVPPKDFDKTCGKGDIAKKYKITHGQVMACFIFVLVNNIFKFHTGNYLSDRDREQAYLFIGHPSTEDWEGPKYANLVQRATNVKEVHIVPESRAAMFSSISNNTNLVSAVKGAVVFDFGSSTADCTYMLLGRKRIEFSYTLGASEIARGMALYALDEAHNSYGEFEISPHAFVRIEKQMRLMKEKFYSNQVERDGEDIICRFAQSPKKIQSIVSINDDFMKQMTEQLQITIRKDSTESMTGSWLSLLREFLREAKNRINNSTYCLIDDDGHVKNERCTIDTIVLTGGASNMDFIYEECKNFFPANVKIIREKNPSYTVATGLSWLALSEFKEKECIDSAVIQVQDNDKCKIENLRTNLSNAMFEKICDIVHNKAEEWANMSGNINARFLKNQINVYMNNPETQKEFSSLCKVEIDSWKNSLADIICDAVNAQAQKVFSNTIVRGIMLPRDLWKQLQPGILKFDKFDLSSILNELDLGGVFNQICKFIIKTVIWYIGMAMAVETSGLSLLFAWITTIIADVIVTDSDLDKTRDQRVRKKVSSKIRELLRKKKDEIMKAFNENLAQETSKFDTIYKNLVISAFEVVTLKKFL